MSFIPIYEPWVAETQEENVNAYIRENWISSRGRFVDTFETNLCENNRNGLIAKLAEHNVECGTWFDLPPLDPSVWNLPDGWENMFSQYLNLPCHYTLSSEKLLKIKEAINEYAN